MNFGTASVVKKKNKNRQTTYIVLNNAKEFGDILHAIQTNCCQLIILLYKNKLNKNITIFLKFTFKIITYATNNTIGCLKGCVPLFNI